MVSRILQLIQKSWRIFRYKGIIELSKRICQYVNRKLLLLPYFPPIILRYKRTRTAIGCRDKYIYIDKNHNIVPQPDDIVVEAGACGGLDTATFAKFADRVVAFELSPRNIDKLKQNLRKFDNIEIIEAGLWKENDELEIKYGQGPAEDGILEPDDGATETINEVPVDTIENYVKDLEIDGIDFFKIEAEGVEPEIVEGIGELRPKNIVINADEERDGRPVGADVMESLESIGYDLVGIKRGHILFFTFEDVDHYAFRSEKS